MTEPRKLKVFLSHADEDTSAIRAIFEQLKAEMWISPWFDKKDLYVGQDWKLEVENALQDADAVVIFLSKTSITKESTVQREMSMALDIAENKPPGTIFILPVRLETCIVPKRISRWQWLDYFEGENPYERLLQSLAARAMSIEVNINEFIRTKKSDKESVPTNEKLPSHNIGNLDLTQNVVVVMVLEEHYQKYDSIQMEYVRHLIATTTNEVEENIIVLELKEGSVVLRIRLSERAARELSYQLLDEDPRILDYLYVKEFYREGHPSTRIIVVRPQPFQIKTVIPEVFIGHEFEIEKLRDLLKNPYGKVRIPLILGGGGIGKTLLVKKMLNVARESGVFAAEEPIDLFSTEYRHIDGIQWKIKEIVASLPELKGQPNPFADFVKDKTDTSEKFYECLEKFCATHPLVLAFDTFENLDKVTSDWLFKGAPDGLQVPGLICIIAGRGGEIAGLETYRKNPLVEEVRVSGFTFEEAEDFYQRIVGEFVDLLGDILKATGIESDNSIQQGIEWIWKLTEGHPLRLEMAFRWSKLLDEKSLTDLTADDFEERLMEQVREFGERGLLDMGSLKASRVVFDTLVCMAHVTRRFDEHFLRYLIGKKLIRLDIPGVTEKDILKNLEKYFFVKVRAGSQGEKVLQLHDEMARLVREYIWPFYDPSGQKKRELLTMIDEYYDQLIAVHTGEEAYILRVEKLYYALQRDWKEEGKRMWFDLAEFGNENINKLLPGEIKEYIGKYDPETQYEINRRIAEIEADAHHFNQAIGYWERVKKLGEVEKRSDWILDALVGKFSVSWQVNPEKALNDYLLPAKKLAQAKALDKIAHVYYEIGFAYRQMQDMEKAVRWYEKAIRELQDRPQDELLNATILNDAGYVYAQLGKWGNATKYLNAALDIREDRLLVAMKRLEDGKSKEQNKWHRMKSKSAMFVGLSHNTLGEFHRHAEDLDEALTHYDKAYGIFESESNPYWQAKSLGGRGETHRRMALLAKGQDNKNNYDAYVKRAREDLEESLYLCEKYQLDDERDTVYRRLGRLSHDFALAALEQKDKETARKHLEEAYDYFTHGLDFARKTKEVLEEFENLTELGFLLDDAIEVYGQSKVPAHYKNALGEFAIALKQNSEDSPRIHQFGVFEALLKLEQGAVALTNEEYTGALNLYLAGYKELGMLPGYGVARYKQHFDHLTHQIENLPKDQQVRWCRKFIQTWRETPSGRPGKMLADDLIPDLVQWCNRLLISIGKTL